jgi:hypothetical protein
MTRNLQRKVLPTTESKEKTKKAYILKYHVNNPQASASEIAQKVKTTISYVWKVLSEARKPSKEIRGRNGRIFAHGKVFYGWWITQNTLSMLNAPVVNPRTGMKQIGSRRWQDPCSCQIHANGHLIIWPRSLAWREWLAEELTLCGLTMEESRLIVEKSELNVAVVEGGLKPGDPGFLPKDFCLQTEWGLVVVRDDTPEKGVLEVKLSIPDMQRYLGLPEIRKRLEIIEQGSMTQAQLQRTIQALLISLTRELQEQNRFTRDKGEGERHC